MKFITTFIMFSTEIENEACHCSVESEGSGFYHNPFSVTDHFNVGGSGNASDYMTRINIGLGQGFLFLLKQKQSVNHFFPRL